MIQGVSYSVKAYCGESEIRLPEKSFLQKQESRFSLSGFPLAWE
jgi:hypothetical protein